jgi:hypothetical protein
MTSAKFFKFNYMIALSMIDWLIDCLMSSELYFSHIQDENKFTSKNWGPVLERMPRSLHVKDPPAEFVKRRPLGPYLG